LLVVIWVVLGFGSEVAVVVARVDVARVEVAVVDVAGVDVVRGRRSRCRCGAWSA